MQQKVLFTLSDKLLDGKTSPKLYWSVLKTFLNNKKIPCFPPLLQNDKFIMDFNENYKSLMISLQSSVLLLVTTANFLLKNMRVTFNS